MGQASCVLGVRGCVVGGASLDWRLWKCVCGGASLDVSLWVPHLEDLSLRAQALGAELHDRVGAEGVSDAVLTERAQPQRQAGLQLKRRDEDGLVARVHTGRQETRQGQHTRQKVSPSI